MRYDFKDGQWRFENSEVVVHVDQDTYQRHINTQLEQRGLPAQLSLHLQKYQRTILDERLAVAKELRDPGYWLNVGETAIKVQYKTPIKRS